MEVREATPDDAPAIESLARSDIDADRLVVDRRVIVAEENGELLGFLSYETWGGAVHVSTLVGDPAIVDALLEEPRRFGDREGLPVEIVIPESDSTLLEALEEAGFTPVGGGPAFHGEESRRFRDTG